MTGDVERVAYTPDEAAAALGIGRSLVYRLMNSGELAYRQCGGRRLIARTTLERYVDPSHHTTVVAEDVFT